MKRFAKYSLMMSVFGALICGCASVQQVDYQRPELPTKDSWSQATGFPEQTMQLRWWENFADPFLNHLINHATTHNIDLRIASARIKEAEAALEREKALGLPSIGVGATKTDLQRFNGSANFSEKRYSSSAVLNWEIDLWGKLAKGVDAARAGYAASKAQRQALTLAIASTVASTYFRLRRLDEEISLQQEAIRYSNQSLDAYQSMAKAGFATLTQVDSQQAESNRLQRESLDLQRRRATLEHRLATLIGIPAGELRVASGRLRGIVRPVNVPIGLPSTMVSRRPDIIVAEYYVLEAHNLLGKAHLEKLPSFSLTGGAGAVSSALKKLLDTWSLGLSAAIRIPIFDPTIQANIKANEARSEQAIETYRLTVMQAYEEVENALVDLNNRRKQHELLERQIKKLQGIAGLRRSQMQSGLASQLELFEVERSLLEASQAMLGNYEALLIDTVTLYESLGGGWEQQAVSTASNLAIQDHTRTVQ